MSENQKKEPNFAKEIKEGKPKYEKIKDFNHFFESYNNIKSDVIIEESFREAAKQNNTFLENNFLKKWNEMNTGYTEKQLYQRYNEIKKIVQKELKYKRKTQGDTSIEEDRKWNPGEGNSINFNNKTILIMENSIYTENERLTTDNRVIYEHKLILDRNFKLKKRTKFKNKEYFSFEFNEMTFDTIDEKLIPGIVEPKLYLAGSKGKDIIKRVINEKSKQLPLLDPKLVIGFENGWILPDVEDENKYLIITETDDQRDIYDSAKSKTKSYNTKEKTHLIEKLKKLINVTQTDKSKLAIVIGWSISSLFKLPILKYLKLFPGLILLGDNDSGKTYLVYYFCIRFFNVWKEYLSKSTIIKPSRFEDILSTAVFPVQIDEIKSLHSDIIELILETLTGVAKYKRKTDVYHAFGRPKVAPITITTNELPKTFQDPALISKMIILHFIDEKIKADKNQDDWITITNELEKYSMFPFIYEYTKDWNDENIKQKIELIKQNIPNNISNSRLKKKLISIKLGLDLFKEVFDINIQTQYKVEDKEIINLLEESTVISANNLLNEFISFCKINIDYYNKINKDPEYTPVLDENGNGIVDENGNPKFKNTKERIDRITYINVKLETGNDKNRQEYYKFFYEHFHDFRNMTTFKHINSLKDLFNNLQDALGSNKNLIDYTNMYKDKNCNPPKGIKINKELLNLEENDNNIPDLFDEDYSLSTK